MLFGIYKCWHVSSWLLVCLFRFVITIFPQAQSSVLEEEIADMDELLMQNDSLNGACQFVKPPPSPFSSRKAMYENEEVILCSCSADHDASIICCHDLARQSIKCYV